MRLKTFLGKDMKDALAQVRGELGENAVIVAQPKSKGGVVVRAAAEDATPTAKEAAPNRSPVLASFEERLARLRNGPGSEKPRHAFDRGALLSILRANRVPESLVPVLAEEAEKHALPDLVFALASAIDRRMRTCPVDVHEPSARLLGRADGAGKNPGAGETAGPGC